MLGPSAIVGVLVAVAVAAAGFLFVQRMAGADVQLPDTLAGFPQRHDQIADEADQEMEAALDEFGVAYDGGIYGTGPMPEFIIVIAQGESTGTTDEMFDEFVAGLTQAGAQVASEGTSDDLGGTPHRCVGLRVQGADMGACSWFADGEGGFVLDFDGDHRTTEALLVTIWPELQA